MYVYTYVHFVLLGLIQACLPYQMSTPPKVLENALGIKSLRCTYTYVYEEVKLLVSRINK